MNFRLAFLFCCFFMLWQSIGIAAPGELRDGDGANYNPHNFSNRSLNGIKADTLGTLDETQICIFCHTPHSSSPDTPLWSRKAPQTPLTSFPLYASGTLVIDDAGVINNSLYVAGNTSIEYPNGASKMCLSCHDGVTAIGEVIGADISVNGGIEKTMSSVGSSLYFGIGRDLDLTNTHPVSFTYDAAVYSAIDTAKPGTYIPASAAILDKYGRMQCTTCHEPHFDTRDGLYNLPFWRKRGVISEADDYDSTCTQCHVGVLNPTLPTGTGHPL